MNCKLLKLASCFALLLMRRIFTLLLAITFWVDSVNLDDFFFQVDNFHVDYAAILAYADNYQDNYYEISSNVIPGQPIGYRVHDRLIKVRFDLDSAVTIKSSLNKQNLFDFYIKTRPNSPHKIYLMSRRFLKNCSFRI
jgi:hypothetical protein